MDLAQSLAFIALLPLSPYTAWPMQYRDSYNVKAHNELDFH